MNEYKCERCNYSTKYAQNFKRHINSSKHKKKVCAPIDETKKYVCECGKKYKFQMVYQNININVNLYLKKNFKLLLPKRMKK